MSSNRLPLLVAATVLLGACSTAQTHIGDEDPGMGESLKYDQALQTINPAPVYPPDAAQPGSNGDTGAAAVKRYRTDTVKPVQTMETTAGGNATNSATGPQ